MGRPLIDKAAQGLAPVGGGDGKPLGREIVLQHLADFGFVVDDDDVRFFVHCRRLLRPRAATRPNRRGPSPETIVTKNPFRRNHAEKSKH